MTTHSPRSLSLSLALTVSRPRYALTRLCITQKGAAPTCLPQYIPPPATERGRGMPHASSLGNLSHNSQGRHRRQRRCQRRRRQGQRRCAALNLNEGWLSPEAARDSHSKPKPKLLQGELLQLTVARGRVLANASLTHSMHSLTQQLSCTQLCRVASVWATEFSISCRCFWGFPSCSSSFSCPSPCF